MLVRNNFKRIGEILLNSFAGFAITMLILSALLFYSSQVMAADPLNGSFQTRCIKNSANTDPLLSAIYGKNVTGTTKGLVHFDGKIWNVVSYGYADQWCLKPIWKMVFSYNISSIKGGILKGKQTGMTFELTDRFLLPFFQKQEVFEKKDWKLHEKVQIAGKNSNVVGLGKFAKNGKAFNVKFSMDSRTLQLNGDLELLRKSSL